MRSHVLLLAALIALLVSSLSLAQSIPGLVRAPERDQLEPATIIRVVDGDTVHVNLNGADVTLQLIGIDTPETVDPRKPVACFGREASAFTKEMLVPGTDVWLEKDISDTDRYQRLLRYIWIAYDSKDQRFTGLDGLDNVEDGELVLFNQLLVSQGYAASSAYPPDVEYQDTFIDDQRVAREANRGLWGACSTFGVPADRSGQAEVESTSEAVVGSSGGDCDPSYSSVCIAPISVAGDLDCRDVPYRHFQVLPPDPHGFDGNSDGEGCES